MACHGKLMCETCGTVAGVWTSTGSMDVIYAQLFIPQEKDGSDASTSSTVVQSPSEPAP